MADKVINLTPDKKGIINKTISVGSDPTVLNFTSFADKDALLYKRERKSLVIYTNDNSIYVNIKNYFVSEEGKGTNCGFYAFQYSDGTRENIVSIAALQDIITQGDFAVIKNTVYGTPWDDLINMGNLHAIIAYSGGGNDIITSSKYADIIYTQDGNDTVKFLGQFNNDKLYAGSGQITIEMDKYTDFEIKGKSLLLKKDDNTAEIVNYMTQGGNILVKVGHNDSVTLNELVGVRELSQDKPNKSFTAKGSYLDENMYGGNKNDKFYGVGGKNYMCGYAGNDTYYGGVGSDTFAYYSGKDKIYNSTSADRLKLYDGNITDFDVYKNGNDLVMYYNHNNFGKDHNITIKDYFKNPDKMDKIIEKNGKEKSISNDVKTYIKCGKGNITTKITSNTVLVLEKAVAVKYARSLDKRDLIIYQYSAGSKNLKSAGSITIKNYFKEDGSVQYPKLTCLMSDGVTSENIKEKLEGGEYLYFKAPDKPYSTEEGDNYISGMQYRNIIVGGKQSETIESTQNKNIFDSRAGDDVITSGNYESEFYYSAGFDKYVGGNKNDTYRVGFNINYLENKGLSGSGFTKKSALYVRDNGGNDTLQIGAKTEDLCLFFDVGKDGSLVLDQELAFSQSNNHIWDSLFIFNKNTLTGKNIQSMLDSKTYFGAIELDNYFMNVYKIENIYSGLTAKGDEECTLLELEGDGKWIDSVRNNVEAWLNNGEHADYASASAVLASGNADDINALIAVYNSSSYIG